MTFQPQSFLRDAVSKGDLEQVRVALSTYLSKNPTNEGNEVTDAADYAESRMAEPLWVEHDHEYMESDKSKWTADYLGLLKSDLRHNFSKERFLFTIEVGKVVRPSKGPVKASPVVAPQSSRGVGLGKPKKIWLAIAGLGGLLIILLLILLTSTKSL